MNSRTVKKRMLRSSRLIFWGHRAFADMRVPLNLFAVPPPALPAVPAHLRPGPFYGYFQDHEDEEKMTEEITISKLMSGAAPDEMSRGFPYVLKGSVTKTPYDTYYWWESKRSVRLPEDQVVDGREFEVAPYDQPWVHDFIALSKWESAALCDAAHPLLDRLLVTANYAKSLHLFREQNAVRFAYGVNYRNLKDFARFCAKFSRAHKFAKRSGIEVHAVL